MKNKVLMGTCALAACLAACTNEELLPVQSDNNGTTTTEAAFVGADLASKGMNIIVNDGGVGTRATDGKWDANDQFGLGWFNYGVQMSSEQVYNTWKSKAAAGYSSTDTKLYANHIFTRQGNDFVTTTDVYQGAYFVYWPYEKLGAITDKVVEVNKAPQTKDFDWEMDNVALHLSAQDFIKAEEGVDPETNMLTKEFVLTPVVNALAVQAEPEEAITGATDEAGKYLQGFEITKLVVNAGGNANTTKPFVTKANLAPSYLPKVVVKNNAIDVNATLDAMDVATNKATGTSASYLKTNPTRTTSASLTTDIDADMTLGEGGKIRAFFFPIQKGVTYTAAQYPTATVTVGRAAQGNVAGYALGTFNVAYNATNTVNNEAFAEKLKDALSTENATKEGAVTLTKLLRTNTVDGSDDYTWQPLNLTAMLTLDNFTPTLTNIKTQAQYEDVVKMIDALVAIKGAEWTEAKLKNKYITLSGKVEFDEVIAPANGFEVTIRATGSSAMVIKKDAKVTWPENLLTDDNMNITIEKDAELTFDPAEAAAINAAITNNGTIYAGELASISNKTATALDNTNGRVEVEYGAYVYPTKDKNGIIAFELTKETVDPIAKINVLVKGGKEEQANINTLIVNATTLDLDAKVEGVDGEEDRYEGTVGASAGQALTNLAGVSVELEGGNVISKNLGQVNNVVAVSGENTITDIRPQGDITVEKGATLNINTDEKNPKNVFLTSGATVETEGTLNANTTIYTTYVVNKVGTMNVKKGEHIYYIDNNYTQGGQTTGEVVSTSGSKEAQAVANVMDALMTGANNAVVTSEEAFLADLNKNVPSGYNPDLVEGAYYVAFYNTLSTWLESIGEEGLDTEKGTSTITPAMLALYSSITGYEFKWTGAGA